MKFSLLYEIALPIDVAEGGKTEYEAYWEAVEQIKLAEEMGFDYVWVVEHHFLEDLSRSSAPEIFLSAVAQHTSKIRIGHGVVLMPPPFSHPYRIAERIGTLDIMTKGRVEFGCGRSVTITELEGYGVPPGEAREMMQEAMRIVPEMWRHHEFPGYKGQYMDLPPRIVVPKPIQKPHPPLWMACGSSTSFKTAGQLGVGCLSFTTSSPPELKERLDSYREGLKECTNPIGDFINAQVAGFTTLYVDEDDQAAREWGGPNAVAHMGRITRYFGEITKYAGYNEYSASLHERTEIAQGGVDPMEAANKYIGEARMCVGSPDSCAEIISRYQEIGIDQFMGVVQFSSITHEQTMRTIRLMGEQVIPRFRKQAEAA
jgi:alkanesulfonate monooxygenase SsuD/methylene tetrahydromethanopterin reductase-like flavin-dependent oxidoreductase (luciferase family)